MQLYNVKCVKTHMSDKIVNSSLYTAYKLESYIH